MPRPNGSLSFWPLRRGTGQQAVRSAGGIESNPEQRLLVEEVKVGCTQGMLLCLDRADRTAYVLGMQDLLRSGRFRVLQWTVAWPNTHPYFSSSPAMINCWISVVPS